MGQAAPSPPWQKPTPGNATRRARATRLAIVLLAVLLALTSVIVTAVFLPAETEPLPAIAPPSGSGRIVYPAGHYPMLAWPDGQHRVVHSLLDTGGPMAFGSFAWNDAGVPMGPVWIRIDLRLQTLSVFRSGHEIGTAVILYGADGKPTPAGLYPILERAANHRSTLYDAEMPYMLRLTGDGIAIHASNVRASSATHGCIGVPLEFAKRLFGQMKRGDPVVIVGPAKPGRMAP